MTTIVIDENINLQKTHFSSLKEVYEVLYEELLEQKMQYAKENEGFINL